MSQNKNTMTIDFLRTLAALAPNVTLNDAFNLLDKAESAAATPPRKNGKTGVWHNGAFFSDKAERHMQNNQKAAAIKEVFKGNQNGKPYGDPDYFCLNQARDAVESRMLWMGYPY